jgi:spore maturation protein CgeB
MELEKSKAFNGAKIVVNTFQGEVEGVNLRTFEAAGCGAFQICEYRTALEELFEIGKEIVIFKNRDDLLEKVEYYLTHPEERKRIANAGHERANRDHTYKERIEKMLQIIHDRD